jgi:hypothetical protein
VEGLLRVSLLDCRDETAEHLCSLVLIHPAGDAAHLGLSDVRLLGALVEGWDDERRRSTPSRVKGLPRGQRRRARSAPGGGGT